MTDQQKDRALPHSVVFTGAGISAESGLQTFRDADGIWQQYAIEEVATPKGWEKDPAKVLEFYNQRRQQVRQARPNAAHFALAELADYYRVTIITQNIDDLHERAGSKNVLHLHGEIMKSRSTKDPTLLYDLGDKDIVLGDRCELGSQLRPHVVWFHEDVPAFEEAVDITRQADLFVVIGTLLAVYPAASLLEYVPRGVQKHVVAPQLEGVPPDIIWHRSKAAEKVPELVRLWISKGIH